MDPETRFTRLEAAYNSLLKQLNTLEEKLTNLEQTRPIEPTNKFKIPLPPIFNAAEPLPHLLDSELSNWSFLAKQYLAITDLTKDPTGVYVISSRLQGHAASWFRSQCTTHSRNYIDPIKLIDDLVLAFRPTNAVEAARDSIAELKQTKSVLEYTKIFQELLLAIPDIHQSEILDKYKRGLKSKIKQQVKLQKCQDLNAMITVALAAENTTQNPAYVSWDTSTPTSAPTTSVPMEIDAVEIAEIQRAQQRPFSKLNEEQKIILTKYHGCFKCRRIFSEHRFSNCPENNHYKKPANQDRAHEAAAIEVYETGSESSTS